MGDLLITGAAGQVAGMLRPYLRKRFGSLILSDRVAPDGLEAGESFRPAELTDPDTLDAALAGVDRVLHLGGQPVEAAWETVRAANIDGLMSFYEAARRAGVARVVYASSVHAVGFYPRERRIGVGHPVRPDSLYGVSKVFGEALGALYADKHGMRVLSIRIGNVNPRPIDRRRLSIWVHPEDLFQLCEIGLSHPDIHNQVVFGASDNARGWWDNAEAFALGYRPRHRAEDYAAEVLAAEEPGDPVSEAFQGGTFCAEGFDGDLERTRWA